MKEEITGLVIRTAYNNQGWAGRCIKPLSDLKCFKCKEGGLYINEGKPVDEDEHGVCRGNAEDYPGPVVHEEPYWCWEQILCRDYFWGNVKGKWRSVAVGMPVYFVYPEVNGTLTLWGHSEIARIDNTLPKYPPIYFKPFEPLDRGNWIKDLTGEEITGKSWRQLHFRYLDETHQNYLASLINGTGQRGQGEKLVQSPQPFSAVGIELRQDIEEKLEKIAHLEGRDVKDLVREAIAKLIRERGVK